MEALHSLVVCVIGDMRVGTVVGFAGESFRRFEDVGVGMSMVRQCLHL